MPTEKRRMGFAVMDPAEHRKLARLGGLIAHRYGGAHKWTSEEARKAGSLGGKARAAKAAAKKAQA